MTDNIKQAIAETIANDKSYLYLFEDISIEETKTIEKCMEDVAIRYHELMTEKTFKELPKVGDKLIAIDECIINEMGEKTLTINKEYPILIIKGYLGIIDDLGCEHFFEFKTLPKFFKPAL